MSLWRQLTRGLRALTNRAAADQDTADEVEDFFEQTTAAPEASGLTPDEARRRARLELGSTLARELLERSRSFDSMAVVKPWGPTLTGSAEPERLDGQRVSVDYFRAFAVAPALGRDFEAADDQLNGPGVVVLSHALWRRRFNSDAAILGRHMMLDGEPYTVVGVMPGDFRDRASSLGAVVGAALWRAGPARERVSDRMLCSRVGCRPGRSRDHITG